MVENKRNTPDCPVATTALRQQLHEQVDQIADFCENCDGRFFTFEKKLQPLVWGVGRLLIALFLLARHQRLQSQQQSYAGYRLFPKWLPRNLRTMFGAVRYQRAYWTRRQGGGGFHPLDAELGLTRD